MSNDPQDPGGETNFGISKRSYPDLDIAGLTVADATDDLLDGLLAARCCHVHLATIRRQAV